MLISGLGGTGVAGGAFDPVGNDGAGGRELRGVAALQAVENIRRAIDQEDGGGSGGAVEIKHS